MDDDDSKVWSLYDAGPKSIRCPIIFLPPVSGTAEVFFQQVLALSGWGYRVISVRSTTVGIISGTPVWKCDTIKQATCVILESFVKCSFILEVFAHGLVMIYV